MKKILFVVTVCVMFASVARGANLFDEFTNNVTKVTADVAQRNMDNFAKDLGVLMAGGQFHQGKALGFPGFDVGIKTPVKKIGNDNVIAKAAGVNTLVFPALQAEIGLPAKVDLIGRYSAYENASITGMGLRYGIIKGALPGLPSLAVQSMYSSLNVSSGANKLKATNIAFSGVASIDLPIFVPYLGITYSTTKIEPDSSLPLPRSGITGDASGVIIEGGINLDILPFTYLQVGAILAEGDLGYSAGLGVKF